MAMKGIEDPAARAIVSNTQAAAIAELAAQGQVVQKMSAEARASLVSIASDTPWAPGDLAKVLDALTKAEEDAPKAKRMPTQVSAIVMASSSNQQHIAAASSNQQLPAAISSHQQQLVAASIHQQQPATSNQRST